MNILYNVHSSCFCVWIFFYFISEPHLYRQLEKQGINLKFMLLRKIQMQLLHLPHLYVFQSCHSLNKPLSIICCSLDILECPWLLSGCDWLSLFEVAFFFCTYNAKLIMGWCHYSIFVPATALLTCEICFEIHYSVSYLFIAN